MAAMVPARAAAAAPAEAFGSPLAHRPVSAPSPPMAATERIPITAEVVDGFIFPAAATHLPEPFWRMAAPAPIGAEREPSSSSPPDRMASSFWTTADTREPADRKSTRLNSSHLG